MRYCMDLHVRLLYEEIATFISNIALDFSIEDTAVAIGLKNYHFL